jgi:hydrogenase nickel incorporation protein HypB
MVYDALKRLNPENGSVIFIENVGNLVCPAMFDLGESKRVVVSSFSEGDNKPIKYPNIFLSADLCLLNKSDLAKYCDFNLSLFRDNILKVNHHLEIIELSVRENSNLTQWFDWLKKNRSL